MTLNKLRARTPLQQRAVRIQPGGGGEGGGEGEGGTFLLNSFPGVRGNSVTKLKYNLESACLSRAVRLLLCR